MRPEEVEVLWETLSAMPPEWWNWQVDNGHYTPAVGVAEDAPLQDQLVALIGRDPLLDSVGRPRQVCRSALATVAYTIPPARRGPRRQRGCHGHVSNLPIVVLWIGKVGVPSFEELGVDGRFGDRRPRTCSSICELVDLLGRIDRDDHGEADAASFSFAGPRSAVRGELVEWEQCEHRAPKLERNEVIGVEHKGPPSCW